MVDEVQDTQGLFVSDRVCVLPMGVVTGVEVEEALHSEFVRWSCEMWLKFRQFGLPHGGGWIDERGLTIAVIEVWETERLMAEKKALKKHQ